MLGKSREEVIKQNNEGKLGGRALLEAFAKMTEAGARYHEQNTKQSNTTKGSWDTLKASISACMGELGTPINDAVCPMLQDMATWVQKNRHELQQLGAKVVPLFQSMADVAATFGKVVVYLGNNVHTLTIELGILANSMRGQVVVGMAKMVASFKPVMAGLRAFRMAAALTGRYWQATMAGMAVAARAVVPSGILS